MAEPTPPSTLSAEAVGRRFVALTALRWLPTGLLIPVTVLLWQDRGMSLAQIGLLSGMQSLTVLLLELPTGGLADALGRRPLLLAAGLLDLVSLALLAVGHSFAILLAAWALQGVFRALESGPLEAWYVDASLAADPGTSIERGLAHAGTAIGLAISAGALASALLGVVAPRFDVDPLTAAVVVSIVLTVVGQIALARLIVETPLGSAATRRQRVRQAVADVPQVVRGGIRLVTGRSALLALVFVEMLWGAGMVGVELLSAPRLVELLGDANKGLVLFGVVAALGWTMCGIGSALTGKVVGWHDGVPARAAFTLRLAQGAAVLAIALVAGPAGLVAGYLGFYVVHGTSNAVHYGMVHRLVGPEHRTTIISANSLTSRIGGLGAAVGLGAVASGYGIPAACAVAAVLLAAAAPLYRIAGRTDPTDGTDPGDRDDPVDPALPLEAGGGAPPDASAAVGGAPVPADTALHA
ncbi:MAG TPA: MFS transporter [Acidimicrobiales bacterium]|nr:MFS transporter [Acidimicrobiales bacterium]